MPFSSGQKVYISQAGEDWGSRASGPWPGLGVGHSYVGGLHGGLRQLWVTDFLEALAVQAVGGSGCRLRCPPLGSPMDFVL